MNPANQQKSVQAGHANEMVDAAARHTSPSVAASQETSEAPMAEQPPEDTAPARPLTIKFITELIEGRRGEVNLFSDLKGIRRELRPFNSWNTHKVIVDDYEIEKRCINSLEEIAKQVSGSKKRLQVLSLAAKNRAEAISEKSDFYPASIPLMASLFAALLIISGDAPLVKWIFGVSALILVFIFVYVRLGSRRQVADLKIIANILDAVEKRIQ